MSLFYFKKVKCANAFGFLHPPACKDASQPSDTEKRGCSCSEPGGGGAAAGYKLGLLHTCPQTPLLHSVAALPEPGFPSDTRALPLPVQPDTRL